MQLITLDFETMYSKQYSLSVLTTEEYVRDERFEVIGVAVKVGAGETVWCTGEKHEIAEFLNGFAWEDSMVLCQNTAFDAAILEWVFDIHPKAYADTMSMGQALHGINKSVSLKNLAVQYGVGVKGEEVLAALGKHRLDFTPEELAKYGEYCRNDVELTYQLFKRMLPSFTSKELKLIDCTIKMFARPKFEMDIELLKNHLTEVIRKKVQLFESSQCTAEVLNSNAKFAALLESFGVAPPMKTSPTTGKETYAFAKTDEDFKLLLEHPDERVQALVAARLGTKSTIEESRTQRFIAMGQRGTVPIPLKYSGAAVTHRWAGFDKINLQNLPRKGALRKALIAPKGHVVLAGDLSNIELRLGMWLAKQDDAVKKIAAGIDMYRDFASQAFGLNYEDIPKDSDTRFIAKVCCIAEGELVLTRNGLIPIEEVTVDDDVWDGVEWVTHDGVMFMGEREVITYDGLTATADHKIWTEDGRYICFGQAASRLEKLARTGNGREAIPYVDNNKRPNHTAWKAQICKRAMRLWCAAVSGAREFNPWRKQVMPLMRNEKRSQTTGEPIGRDTTSSNPSETSECHESTVQQPERSGVWKLRWAWDTVPIQVYSRMCALFTNLTQLYGKIRDRSGGQQRALCAGESKVYHTFNSDEEPAQAKTTKKVYDIINAGPRHRFTVSGRLVSNCLSLIYGTGAEKLKNTIRIQSGGKTTVPIEEAEHLKNVYRENYSWVVDSWRQGQTVLETILEGKTTEFLRQGIIEVTPQGLVKPGGLVLAYPDLKKTRNDEGFWEYTYAQKRGVRDKVYGSKVYQRCTQSLARDIIGDMVLELDKLFGVVLQVHDEIVCIVPEAEAEAAKTKMLEVMSTPRDWYFDLPLAAEAGYGASYGDAK